MAKNTKAVVEDIDIDIEDLEIEGVEVEEIEEAVADDIETELEEKASTPKKAKKEKASTGSGLTSTKPLADDEVGASYIADQCGVESREIRAFLRKNYRNMDDDKSKRYAWKKDDPQVQEIIDAFKAKSRVSRTEKVEKDEPVGQPKVEVKARVETPVATKPATKSTAAAGKTHQKSK